MILLKEGKTNWKYVLVIVFLAFIVGGGILWFSTREKIFIEFPEIKQPETPEEIEKITKTPTIAGFINDSRFDYTNGIYILDNYAYVISDDGLVILDVSNPRSPTIIASFEELKNERKFFNLKDSEGIFVLDKFAYILNDSTLAIVNVSNPNTPILTGLISDPKLTGWSRRIFVLNGYAYIIGDSYQALYVIDVSNPEMPTIVGSVSFESGSRYWHYQLFVPEKYAYIVSKYRPRFFIIDIANPKAPELVGSISDPKLEEAKDLFISDKYAYILTEENRLLVIIDISNPVTPLIVGSIEVPRLEFSWGIYVSGKYAYVNGDSSLTIVDVSDPKKPEIVISIFEQKLERPRAIDVSGRYIFMVASGAKNFVILDIKGEIVFSPKSIPVLSKEVLELEEKFIGKDEREVAFIQQNGDVWVVSKDLKKKYKITDTLERIYFSSLANRRLSSDGNYIVSEELEGYTGCCGAEIPTIPIYSLWIEKLDGTEKAKVERPAEVWRSLIFFDGWLPDSRKILFHFSDPDEATQGSAYFEVGIDGKNPKVYTEIFKIFKEGVEVNVEDLTAKDIADITMTVVGTEPVYSPTGEKVAYIREETEIRLKDIKTKETKTILALEEFPVAFGPASRVLIWSEDGSLLSVKGLNKIFIFNKKGEIILETEFKEAEEIEDVVLSLDNKYLAGTYRMKGERIEIVFFIDLITKEKKEFKLPEFKDYPEKINIYSPTFSKSNRLYYCLVFEPISSGAKESTSQLWVIDTNTWKNYKITENVSQVVNVP